ncbi:MAG: hypothetical protein ABEJ57_03520 [Halobacteriaceae archaeon]
MSTEDVDERSAALGSGLTRYDLVLLAIPAAFLLAALLSTVATVPTHVAVGTGAALAAAAVGDGLFRNPPIPPRSAA